MVVQYLQDVGLYESKEEAVRREEVLGILDQVFQHFWILWTCAYRFFLSDVCNKSVIDLHWLCVQIVKTWIKTISRAKGLNDQLLHEANAKIFTFGSYRLGVTIKFYRRFSFDFLILLVLQKLGKGTKWTGESCVLFLLSLDVLLWELESIVFTCSLCSFKHVEINVIYVTSIVSVWAFQAFQLLLNLGHTRVLFVVAIGTWRDNFILKFSVS